MSRHLITASALAALSALTSATAFAEESPAFAARTASLLQNAREMTAPQQASARTIERDAQADDALSRS